MRRNSPLLVLSLLGVAGPVGLLLAGTPADAATTVTGTARQWVNVRNAPASTATTVGSLSAGQQVTVACQQAGTTVNGPGGATNLWDRIGDGRFVSHSYVSSLTGTPPRCETMPVAGAAKQWVNVRSGPATNAAVVGSLASGQSVTVECQTAGTGGSWHRIGAGRFVMANFVTLAAGTPVSCAAVPAPAVSTPPASAPAPKSSAPASAPAPKSSAPAPKPSTPAAKPSTPAPSPTVPTPTLTVPAPPAGLNAEQIAFFNLVAGPARQNFVESKVPASVTMAQAILESGWGRGDIPRLANNYFGAKCVNGAPGTVAIGCRNFPTKECNASGCHPAIGNFKVFRSALDSIRDHALVLTKSRYAAAFANPTDSNRFAAEIHKGGYATDPNYTKLLTDLMKKYDLYRYDR